MTALFIANCTKQNHVFAYRQDSSTALSYQDIRIGAQVKLPGDMTSAEVANIIKQHITYGIKDASEVRRTKDFTGLCYNIDQPVPFVAFDSALETNDVAMTERSAEQRERVVNAIADKSIEISRDAGDKLQRIEVSTETDKAAQGIPEISLGSEVVMMGVQPKRGNLRKR